MTAAYPWVLWGTLFAALAVVAAHLLSISRPPVLSFPTARFAPERTVPSVSRASRPTDVLLMVLRMFAVICAGVAFAGVTFDQSRESVVTLIAVDDMVAADTAVLRRSIGEVVRDAQRDNTPVVGIVSTSGATPMDGLWDAETIATAPINAITGSALTDNNPQRVNTRDPVALSALLLRARRAAPQFASRADSVRLVVLTPARGALREVSDEALRAVRQVWPGRITRRDVALASPSAYVNRARDVVNVRGANDDIVRAAYARWGDLPAVRTRVVRDSLGAADSLAAVNGEAVVDWVARGASNAAAPISKTPTRAVTAVVANGVALVAPLRREKPLLVDSAHHAIVWWIDGAPAAVERHVGAGCIRVVGFAPPAGDALLSVSARGALAALVAKCGAGVASSFATGALTLQDSLARSQQDSILTGNGGLAASRELRASLPGVLSPLTRWLLVAAVALIGIETALSRTRGGSPS